LNYIEDPFTDDTLAHLLVEGLMGSIRESANQPEVPDNYHLLWLQQTTIGWTGLFCGLLSKEWYRLQTQHLSSCPDTIPASHTNERPLQKPKTVQVWLAKLISLCQRHWNTLWTLRNSSQHGSADNPQAKAAAKRKHLLQEIQSVTDLHDYLPPIYQEAIGHHLQHQDRMPISSLTEWLTVFGPLYRTVAHRTIAAGRRGLQTITSFFFPKQPEDDKYPP